MSKTKNSEAQEPPLPVVVKGFFVLLATFIIVLARRIYAYLENTFTALRGFGYALVGRVIIIKRFFIRMLMYRGGIFHDSPRLGLAAILSTTGVAMFIVPAFEPLTESYTLDRLLAGQHSVMQPSEFSMNVLAAPPSLSTTSTGRDIRTEVFVHTVAPGDTLSAIAELYLVSVEGLKYVNDMNSDFLSLGDELKIPPVDGLFHIVEDGDTLASISGKYSVPEQAIADFNYLEEPFLLQGGQELIIPNASIPKPAPVSVYAYNQDPMGGLVLETVVNPQVGTGGFVMPTKAMLTQYFWWGHTAIDLATSCGTPIVAADSGTITFAGWWAGGGGNSTWIDHGNGYVTKYAHMSGFERTGGTVQRGEVIGYMGSTGRSTGCHLHFMVYYNGVAIDPLTVL